MDRTSFSLDEISVNVPPNRTRVFAQRAEAEIPDRVWSVFLGCSCWIISQRSVRVSQASGDPVHSHHRLRPHHPAASFCIRRKWPAADCCFADLQLFAPGVQAHAWDAVRALVRWSRRACLSSEPWAAPAASPRSVLRSQVSVTRATRLIHVIANLILSPLALIPAPPPPHLDICHLGLLDVKMCKKSCSRLETFLWDREGSRTYAWIISCAYNVYFAIK